MRCIVRSVLVLYTSTHRVEQNCFMANLRRISPKRPLHWSQRFVWVLPEVAVSWWNLLAFLLYWLPWALSGRGALIANPI